MDFLGWRKGRFSTILNLPFYENNIFLLLSWIDREFGIVAAGVVGPVESKLLSFSPLQRCSFGVWGKASLKDVQCTSWLIIWQSRASATNRCLRRRRSKEADVAMFIGQIRCTLSLEAVKAHARL